VSTCEWQSGQRCKCCQLNEFMHSELYIFIGAPKSKDKRKHKDKRETKYVDKDQVFQAIKLARNFDLCAENSLKPTTSAAERFQDAAQADACSHDIRYRDFISSASMFATEMVHEGQKYKNKLENIKQKFAEFRQNVEAEKKAVDEKEKKMAKAMQKLREKLVNL
jgi:cell division protein ZapA (FtsZ GTPase activity inhibitor)